MACCGSLAWLHSMAESQAVGAWAPGARNQPGMVLCTATLHVTVWQPSRWYRLVPSMICLLDRATAHEPPCIGST